METGITYGYTPSRSFLMRERAAIWDTSHFVIMGDSVVVMPKCSLFLLDVEVRPILVRVDVLRKQHKVILMKVRSLEWKSYEKSSRTFLLHVPDKCSSASNWTGVSLTTTSMAHLCEREWNAKRKRFLRLESLQRSYLWTHVTKMERAHSFQLRFTAWELKILKFR